MIVVHHLGGPPPVDEYHVYEYRQIVGNTLTLVTGLLRPAYSTNKAACMVPLVQTTLHQDNVGTGTWAPRKDDVVRFYEHGKLSNNPGGYDSWGYPGGGAAPVSHAATVKDIGTMTDPADPAHPLAQYPGWPSTRMPTPRAPRPTGSSTRLRPEVYAGEGDFFDPAARRWKVLNTAAGTLSGELPCYPGTTFRIGGPAAGGSGADFTGDLDEVRVTALPVALPYTGPVNAPADWSAGPNFNVATWAWAPDALLGETRAALITVAAA